MHQQHLHRHLSNNVCYVGWAEGTTKQVHTLDPDLKSYLFVPCDSHGLQLLVKDIVERIPIFKATLEQAQAVIKVFKNMPHQVSFLCEY